ncbi:MAG: histidine kinase [Lachnospiraceae bacterium]|nr:histidine kinase [Lachnospiraceae bacterium]
MVIPLGIIAGVLFYNMEQSTISESVSYMEYKRELYRDQIQTDIDSINMSTRYFSYDEELLNFLKLTRQGHTFTTEELLEFYEGDIADLERLVNNNPLMYAVRVYSSENTVQEMMPILYSADRMKKLEWGEETVCGWHYGYHDTLFSSLITSQENALISLVTEITDYDAGCIGYVEAAVMMKTMFPELYGDTVNEWSFFEDEEGNRYFGSNQPEYALGLIQQMGQGETDRGESSSYLKAEGRKLVVTTLPVSALNGRLVSVMDITGDVRNVYRQRNIFVVVVLLLVILTGIMINYIVKRMLRQFYSILRSIRKVQEGDLSERIVKSSNDEMGELGDQLNTMLNRVQNLMNENIRREVLVKNAQIRSLQNQINAHFIYNVLESVKMLAEIDEEYVISDSITSLGKMLRYSMKWVSGTVTLGQELEYIKSYLALMNLRNDYEAIFSIRIPEELMDQVIPKMSLQPLVENAYLHGIEPEAKDATIYIKASEQEGDFVIEVQDAGRGMTREMLQQVRDNLSLENGGEEKETYGDKENGTLPSSGKGGGIGLKNVNDRIHMAFGNSYGLEVYSEKGLYTKVIMRLPRKDGN